MGLTRAVCWAIGLMMLAVAPPSRADIDPVSGIDFVSVGAPGNSPWPGAIPPIDGDRAVGRGRVDYAFSIGRFEVTTAQWVDFFNAAFNRPVNDRIPHLIPPDAWGAVSTTPNTPGGQRWRVPAGNGMLPVGNISWRMAAIYANWLCNNKGTGRGAFINGAYDVGTFGYVGASGIFTDQFAHNPGARYWIPTWDEWLKSAHFDPNKNGPGQGGWWVYPNKSDTEPPAYGPPGVRVRTTGAYGPDPAGPLAQANAGWSGSLDFPGRSAFSVPLGAYPDAASPWGLLDVAGGTAEWTEEVLLVNGLFPSFRRFDGSSRGQPQPDLADHVSYEGGEFPSISLSYFGLRIASSVPSPGCSALGMGLVVTCLRRSRRIGGSDERVLVRAGGGGAGRGGLPDGLRLGRGDPGAGGRGHAD